MIFRLRSGPSCADALLQFVYARSPRNSSIKSKAVSVTVTTPCFVIINSVPHAFRVLLFSGRQSRDNRREANKLRGLRFKRIPKRGQVAQVVERSPEKAGVGGSTPSRATIIFNHLEASLLVTWSHSVTIQFTKRLSRSTARCWLSATNCW